jgi:hypothetical protein
MLVYLKQINKKYHNNDMLQKIKHIKSFIKKYYGVISYILLSWSLLAYILYKIENIPKQDEFYEASTVGDGGYVIVYIFSPFAILLTINLIVLLGLILGIKNRKTLAVKLLNIIFLAITILFIIRKYS